MQEMTLITILIVNHNSFDFVKTSLYSLSKLTKNKYTVYIVDNSGKKNDYEELKRFTHKDKNIFIFKKNSRTIGSYSHAEALDYLTQKIKTKYFSILDADAIWLKKNWDEILIKKLIKKVKVIGSQAPLPKPQDFPLMFACVFETATFKKLHVSFKPKSIITHKDTGFEMREKYLRAGFVGQNLIMKNTRFFHHGEFQNIICAEYYLGMNKKKELIASHFGRGSTLGVAKYMSNDRFILSRIPILNFLLAKKKGVLEKRKWIDKCYEIINQQNQLTPIMLENVLCDFCNKNKDRLLFSERDTLSNFPGVYNIVKCQNCNLVRTNPRPTKKEITKYYSSDLNYYHPEKPSVKNGLTKIVFHLTLNLYFNYGSSNILIIILQFIFFSFLFYPYWQLKTFGFPSYVKNGNLFEIGSSYGYYLKQITDIGWKTSGIDLDKQSVEWGRTNFKLNLELGDFEKWKIKKNDQFDVVVARMYLEHVFSPEKVLTKINSILRTNGQLIITIPDFDGFESRIFRNNSYTLQVPGHLFHFTPTTIKNYLIKNGFFNIKIYHHNIDRDLIAPIVKLGEKNKLMNLISKLLLNFFVRFFFVKPIVTILSFCGRTSRMTIYCRKNNLM